MLDGLITTRGIPTLFLCKSTDDGILKEKGMFALRFGENQTSRSAANWMKGVTNAAG